MHDGRRATSTGFEGLLWAALAGSCALSACLGGGGDWRLHMHSDQLPLQSTLKMDQQGRSNSSAYFVGSSR